MRTAVAGSTVEFSARVVGDPSAGIQTVFVTYTGESGSPFHPEWESVDLAQVAGDSTLWTGSLTLPAGQQASAVRYLVQAVNGVGLVGIDDNQGSYFVPGIIPGEETGDLQPTALTLGTPVPTAGDYGANVTVRATLRNDAGAALAQRAVTFAIGGASRTAFTDSTGRGHRRSPAERAAGQLSADGELRRRCDDSPVQHRADRLHGRQAADDADPEPVRERGHRHPEGSRRPAAPGEDRLLRVPERRGDRAGRPDRDHRPAGHG